MSPVTLPVALLGFVGFAIELASSKLDPHWRLLHNPALKMLGSFSWLTIQTNYICTVYFAACIYSALGFGLDSVVIQLFPLVFALGSFLTAAYYLLDHFNPANVKARAYFSVRGYPYIGLSTHTQHCFALPLVLLHASRLQMKGKPEDSAMLLTVGGYLAFYITYTFCNKSVSGAWVYPIFDAAQKAGGMAAVCIFVVCLCAVITGFAYAGCWILPAQM